MRYLIVLLLAAGIATAAEEKPIQADEAASKETLDRLAKERGEITIEKQIELVASITARDVPTP